jgi:large subunit ribosomal protein L35
MYAIKFNTIFKYNIFNKGYNMKKIKIKTSKGAKKRFKITGTGKVMHYKAGKSHILTSKAHKRKKRLAKKGIVNAVDSLNIKKLIPYL